MMGKAEKYILICVALILAMSFAGASSNRTLPDNYTPGTSIAVNITIGFDNMSSCVGAVVEYLPSGWDVTGISGEGAGSYNPSVSTITWAPIYSTGCGGSGTNYTLGYIATPNSTQSGTQSFNGTFSIDGSSTTIGGSQDIQQASPSQPENNNGGGGGGGGGSGGGATTAKNNSNSSANITTVINETRNISAGNQSANNESIPVFNINSSKIYIFMLGIVILIIIVAAIAIIVHIRRKRYSLGLRAAVEEANQ